LVDAVATQPTVRKEGVAYFLDGGEAPDDELPQAVFYGGRYYLRNGTTRAAAAILAGKKTLRGRVLDWPSDEAREDRPAPAPTDGGFAKVVKDPAAWAAVLARAREVGPLDNDRQVIRFLRGEGIDKQDQEVFWVVGLDSHNSLRTLAEVARGQRDRVAVDVADVTRPVLLEGCRAFLVAHNHPAGDPAPSDSDKAITAKLREAAAASNVVFLDHLVLGTGKYYSFADKKTKAG
jgi:DNA repair protein RadC